MSRSISLLFAVLVAIGGGDAEAAGCDDWDLAISAPQVEPSITGWACQVRGSLAYVVGYSLKIVDISDPVHMLVLGSLDLPDWGHQIVVEGTHAYITPAGGSNLLVVDVADPFHPAIVGTHDMGCRVERITCIRGMFIAQSGGDLHVLDIRPDGCLEPRFVTRIGPGVRSLASVSGLLALAMSDGIRVFSVGGAHGLNPAGTVLRTATDVTQLSADGSRLYELSSWYEFAGGVPGHRSRVRSYQVSGDGAIAPVGESPLLPLRTGALAADGGVVAAAIDSSAIQLWKGADLAELLRLRNSGFSIDLRGGTLVGVGNQGLSVHTRIHSELAVPGIRAEGDPAVVDGSGTSVQRSGPWLLVTRTTHDGAGTPGYMDVHVAYSLRHGDDPLHTSLVSEGEFSNRISTNPDEPCLAGELDLVGHWGRQAVCCWDTGCEMRVEVWDAAQAEPTQSFTIAPRYAGAMRLTLVGDLLWAADRATETVTRYDLADGDPVGSARQFSLENLYFGTLTSPDRSFVVNWLWQWLDVYDSSDPATLPLVGTCALPAGSWGYPCVWVGRTLVMHHALRIIAVDFTDPTHPSIRFMTGFSSYPREMIVDGSRVVIYTVAGTGLYSPSRTRVWLLDFGVDGGISLSTPIELDFGCTSVELSGDVLYVDNGCSVAAYDIADPLSPVPLGTTERGSGKLAISGDYLTSGTLLLPRDCRDLRPPLPITIEVLATIKPSSTGGYTGPALIPVVVRGSSEFAVTALDRSTVRFGPLGAPETPGPGKRPGGVSLSAMATGPDDLTLWFEAAATGITGQTRVASLTGRTHAGEDVLGTALLGSGPRPDAGQTVLAVSPNPFNPATNLGFRVEVAGRTRLAIHDLRGRLVRLLVDEDLPAGDHLFAWDGKDASGAGVASGTYVARFCSGAASATRRLTLVK